MNDFVENRAKTAHNSLSDVVLTKDMTKDERVKAFMEAIKKPPIEPEHVQQHIVQYIEDNTKRETQCLALVLAKTKAGARGILIALQQLGWEVSFQHRRALKEGHARLYVVGGIEEKKEWMLLYSGQYVSVFFVSTEASMYNWNAYELFLMAKKLRSKTERPDKHIHDVLPHIAYRIAIEMDYTYQALKEKEE